MENKRCENAGVPRGAPAKYALLPRRPEVWEAPGLLCYDLRVTDEDGTVTLQDVARTTMHAEKIRNWFIENKVTSFEAPYAMEDILSDPDMIE